MHLGLVLMKRTLDPENNNSQKAVFAATNSAYQVSYFFHNRIKTVNTSVCEHFLRTLEYVIVQNS